MVSHYQRGPGSKYACPKSPVLLISVNTSVLCLDMFHKLCLSPLEKVVAGTIDVYSGTVHMRCESSCAQRIGLLCFFSGCTAVVA